MRLNVFEIVSGLADGGGSMPAKWNRRVFWLKYYEGKISCASFELADAANMRPYENHIT
jgi:hypothetical protein